MGRTRLITCMLIYLAVGCYIYRGWVFFVDNKLPRSVVGWCCVTVSGLWGLAAGISTSSSRDVQVHPDDGLSIPPSQISFQ